MFMTTQNRNKDGYSEDIIKQNIEYKTLNFFQI